MSITVAKYTFSSWLRKGIGAAINQTDNLGNGAPTVPERATVPIDVQINTQNVHKDFDLLGPGDIIGINPAMVVRTEPLHWITNFEPNYLSFIEFYDEDFIWRYTPAKANGDKLRPWVALLVLMDSDKEEEREFVFNEKRSPLPTVIVKSAENLPPAGQTWAWSHVHVNEGYNATSEFEEFLQSLRNLNNPNADKIICRLVSPRKLVSNKAYRAFVVPAFETGRLAGLGLDTSTTDAQQPSWNDAADNLEMPVYYQWYFRTGDNEDFESLVRLLEPRIMDKRVGIRDMDGSQPGFGMTIGTDIGPVSPPQSNQAIIGLEGALKAPTTKSSPETINTAKPFFTQLRDILNFPAELKKSSNGSSDPVVSPPIYGENHALTHELDINHNGWLHTLNKDPRNRASGGFGTSVIRKNQENYMARAWAQVQKILEANRRILFAAFSMVSAEMISRNFIQRLSPEKTLLFFSPILRKVKGSPNTLHNQLEQSRIPVSAVSATFRRILRPRGPYFAKLRNAEAGFSHVTLLQDLNSGKISAAPPKQAPEDINRVDKLVEKLRPGHLLQFILKHLIWILLIWLLILLIIALFTGAWITCAILALLGIAAYFYLLRWKPLQQLVDNIDDPDKLVTVLKNTPPRGDFHFTETDPVVPQTSGSGTTVTQSNDATSGDPGAVRFVSVISYTPTAPGQDSLEAQRFRRAAIALNSRLRIKAPERVYTPFDIGNAYEKLQKATDPRTVFPRRLASLVHFSFNPEWLFHFEHLVPAMAYPDFEDPMYEKLRDISPELLIPNLDLIPPNTISLLVTNPPFIESYMVGLNHEFGKELLWREYPTDTRCSSFRQFWDVKGIITNETGLTPAQLTEKYKDITPLDKWFSTSALGGHNNRNIHGAKQVVMVVRGELLKKYPNTIIYAQKAHIYKDKEGNPDPSHEPVVVEVQTESEMMTEIKFPIFKADINPDLRFFGFDLTIPQARGEEDPQTESDNWGWYFVIQQMPGEPQFGMDIKFTPDEDKETPITWDDLSWDKYTLTNGFLNTGVKPGDGFTPAGPGESINQWGANSAMMASILYQKPVMIAVHAKEMLANLDN
jgi:hypothetical protein